MPRDLNPTQYRIPDRAMILAVLISVLTMSGLFLNVSSADHSSGHPFLISRVNPNIADLSTLMTLPNIGPNRAAAIVEYRRQHSSERGGFRCVEDLQAVPGIGPKISEDLRPWTEFQAWSGAGDD